MLFPEEIFKMIMKKHKINYLETKLNFKHRIRTHFLSENFSEYSRKKFIIKFHQQPFSRIVITDYLWENKWDLQNPELLGSYF